MTLQPLKVTTIPPIHAPISGSPEPTKISRNVFTHQAFAPRNILVSPEANPPELTVTGIVDFEFAGFFPEEDEILTCMSRQADDWNEETFNSILAHMSRLGMSVPVKKEQFDRLCILDNLIQNVAPWQMGNESIVVEASIKHAIAASELIMNGLVVFEKYSDANKANT